MNKFSLMTLSTDPEFVVFKDNNKLPLSRATSLCKCTRFFLRRGSFGAEMARKRGKERENREIEKNWERAGNDGKGEGWNRFLPSLFPATPNDQRSLCRGRKEVHTSKFSFKSVPKRNHHSVFLTRVTPEEQEPQKPDALAGYCLKGNLIPKNTFVTFLHELIS